MSKNMKLIMESWNGYLSLNERKEIETIGDLKKFFKWTKVKKKGGPAAETATKWLVGFVPFGATMKNVIEAAPDLWSVFSTLYQKDDNFQTSDALSKVNVDDEISKIVDDQVEIDFLKYILDQFKKLPDNTPLEKIDMTDQLRQYLAKTFKDRTVTGDK
jgi:hypothetical protein